MDESRKLSFFPIAAWCAVIGPLFAAGIICLGWHFGLPDKHSKSPAEACFQIAGSMSILSLLASIVSLFGLISHGSRVLLWKAVAGLVLSWSILAVLCFIGMLMIGQQ
jgi:hypothetical protein